MKVERKNMKRILIALLMLSWSVTCFAQEGGSAKPQAKDPSIYKFEFSVYELQGGKKTNARNYMIFLQERHRGAVKVGNRVPVATSKDGGFQYIDVGLNIECRFEDMNGGVNLSGTFDLASIIAPEQGGGMVTNPVIRQLKQDADSYLVPGKPTIIASIDDTNTPRTVQVEVTATKVK
jgi:hypothetical protein